MPELPEVEVVRAGLEQHVVGRRITAVEVLHPRAIRRHEPGASDFVGRLLDTTVTAVRRRGKYLWFDLGDEAALLAHLGMSGQLLLRPPGASDEKHLRVRIDFADHGSQLRFVDQRTFGGLTPDDLVDADGMAVPSAIAHIARDPMDAGFDVDVAAAALRRRRTEVKRALLDQSMVSGVGNIYADEALWRVGLHWARPTDRLTARQARELLTAAADVMAEALKAGGTSFDALYVDVNGESGYFSRSLDVYGRADEPCRRCGTPLIREPFMNRSAFSCPRCQVRPRPAH